MNYGIQYLCYLVQTKNDLNRKRRRFYSILNVRTKYLGQDANGKVMIADYAMHMAYTREIAEAGYVQAQAAMKAMTPEIRKARKEINARFRWAFGGWYVKNIKCGEQTFDALDIAKLAELYKADAILLGD